jgi:hypothetical protein
MLCVSGYLRFQTGHQKSSTLVSEISGRLRKTRLSKRLWQTKSEALNRRVFFLSLPAPKNGCHRDSSAGTGLINKVTGYRFVG